MSDSAAQRFEELYTTLAGHVHVAESQAEAIATIREIVKETGASRVAIANLPDDLERGLVEALGAGDVEVLRAPFEARALPDSIDSAGVGVTGAAFAIAEAGALVEVSTDDAVRLVSTLPRVHIAVVRSRDILATLAEAAPRLRDIFQKHSANCAVTFISGPSRTADIAMQLTLGVHGPEAAHAVILREVASG